MGDERMMNMTRFTEPDWRAGRLHRTARWAALGGSEYDDAGNMTRSPYIDSEVGHARRHAYDAWNRMVAIQFNNGSTVWTLDRTGGPCAAAPSPSQGEGWGEGRTRTDRRTLIPLTRPLPHLGERSPGRHDHDHNRDWQMLETHKDDTLHWQHVWSQRYIDAPVLWDRDASDPADGVLDRKERGVAAALNGGCGVWD